MDEKEAQGSEQERRGLERAIEENRAKTDRLLDGYLEGTVDKDTYQAKARELGQERLGLEHRLQALEAGEKSGRTARVEALLETARSVRIRFRDASTPERRRVLAGVLSNAALRRQEIVDYQLKSPFDLLVIDDDGALIHDKWPVPDLNR